MSLLSAVGFEPGTFSIHVSESEYMLALYLVRHHYLVWHLHGVMDRASVLKYRGREFDSCQGQVSTILGTGPKSHIPSVAFKMAAIYPFR